MSPKFIYSSCPTRGLDTLLYLWPFIRQHFSNAQLDIFYGFENFKSPEQIEFKNKMMAIINDLKNQGVVYHGRVGQKELGGYWKRADIWLYPTRFW